MSVGKCAARKTPLLRVLHLGRGRRSAQSRVCPQAEGRGERRSTGPAPNSFGPAPAGVGQLWGRPPCPHLQLLVFPGFHCPCARGTWPGPAVGSQGHGHEWARATAFLPSQAPPLPPSSLGAATSLVGSCSGQPCVFTRPFLHRPLGLRSVLCPLGSWCQPGSLHQAFALSVPSAWTLSYFHDLHLGMLLTFQGLVKCPPSLCSPCTLCSSLALVTSVSLLSEQ